MCMSTLRRALRKGQKFQNPVDTHVGGLDTMAKVLGLYLKALRGGEKAERVPVVPLGPFRTDARIYEEWPASGLRVTWMGHSVLLVEIDGVRILIDPVWDERASPLGWAGPKRFFEAPLPLHEMPRLDAVVVSHDHYDHLGRKTIEVLAGLEATAEAVWVTPLGVGTILEAYGVAAEQIAELDWTQSVRVLGEEPGAELVVTAMPSRHFSGRSLLNRFETLWASFVLTGTQHRVYYGADSGMWEGFAEVGQEFGPFDLTMLEVGAFNELWKDIHMGPEGAAKAFAAMGGSGLLMPIHWGLFDLALHGWRQPIERITELADAIGMRLWAPEPGAPTEVVAETEVRSGWWKTGSAVRARRLASS